MAIGKVPVVVLLLSLLLGAARSSPSSEPVTCAHGTRDCTVTNAYGSFPDRQVCRAANAVFPSTEQELVAAVAAASAAKSKVKAATKHCHSFTKLACPGGRDGTIISTERLNRTVRVDTGSGLMTVEGGMVLRDLIQAAALAGLALPHSPYWHEVTVGGLLATGAHGSSLWRKGGAVHEYVVGMRIVTPAPASHGFAVVRELVEGDPDLDAVKVSLGVLGVVSQVTLKLQPMFKRSVSLEKRDDTDLAAQAAIWGNMHEFGDMTWLPRQGKVIYRADDRVPTSTPDTDSLLTGNPVVGFQNIIQVSGNNPEEEEEDSSMRGTFLYSSGFSIALSKAPSYIAEVQKLRDLDPSAFCGLNLGVLLRYVRASSAYLGKKDDSLDLDFTYYGEDGHADVMDELEQLALTKYGATPHWGKNRNYAFADAIAKFPRGGEFLKVKDRYDPDGIFSSEWSDQVLGINGSPSIVGRGCASQGLCVCSHDSHCAPEKDYSCQPGKVFREARVCSPRPTATL